MKKKIIKYLKILALLILSILVLALIRPTWTSAIKSNKNSINELKKIEINGAKHTLMIRGADKNNPIIIYVHGGPGCPEIPYVKKYQDILEKKFTIVHYDQRGSGKSYEFFKDYSNLSIDILVDDLLSITDYIRSTYKANKIILVGHSFGTNVGIRAAEKAPDKYLTYVGIGQVSDLVESELDSLEFCIEKAKAANELEDVKALESYRASIMNGSGLAPRSYVRKYGGAARLIDENKDYSNGLFLGTEYNLLDAIRFYRGVNISQKYLMGELLDNKLTKEITHLEIPCYFVSGRYDYMTSLKAAENYLNSIEAPSKEMVILDNSAHYPQFEEESKFAEWMISKFYN